ncbi:MULTISPECIES: hypothetical protein [Sulfurimonas]|uniref:hypothetical protein n=1 Tax=Sulfurimonas TaxID=202746 RepID=UPI001264F991|nr:hypothetical protein [Sulfurimonas indica]
MQKIFLMILLFISSLYAVEMGKIGGCTLTQSGIVKVGYNDVKLETVKYTPNEKVGKNFRELFVGAKLEVEVPAKAKKLSAEVLDYKPNKRIKGKPKTGLFIVKFQYDDKEKTISMPYIFNKGVMKISKNLEEDTRKELGIKEAMKIWFETDVAYSLCYVK